MVLPDLPPPILVTEARGLQALLQDIEGQREIAVDTEADSFYSYREKVCLVQVSVEDRDYLVDPLDGLDLMPFGRVLADPKICKVFHDGEYDVLIMKRDFGFDFAGLFDTRVAAAALGMPAPGLGSVLAERFDVTLDKSMQRSNWAERPLSEKQITYARLDTHFLVRLMHDLQAELNERDRMMIVDGECRRLEALTTQPVEFNPDEFVRIKGVRSLGPKQARVLRELFILRERLAEAADSPLFRVMNNQLLLEIATACPSDMRGLTRLRGFSPRMARKLGDEVLDAVERGLELGPLDRMPRLPKRDGTGRLDEEQTELYDRLKRWRKGIAEKVDIESAYLLNRHVMVRIAASRPKSLAVLDDVDGLLPWQLEMFGEDLLAVVKRFERELANGEIQVKRTRRRG